MEENYFLSYFCFLDLISILSLFLDIHWVYNGITDPEANNYPTKAQIDEYYNVTTSSGSDNMISQSLAKGHKKSKVKTAMHISRVAIVASRTVFILRLIKFFFIFKIEF